MHFAIFCSVQYTVRPRAVTHCHKVRQEGKGRLCAVGSVYNCVLVLVMTLVFVLLLILVLVLDLVLLLDLVLDLGGYRAANNMCKVQKEKTWAWRVRQSELASNYELSLLLEMVLGLIVVRC